MEKKLIKTSGAVLGMMAALALAVPMAMADDTSSTTNMGMLQSPQGGFHDGDHHGDWGEHRPTVMGQVTAISGNTITVQQRLGRPDDHASTQATTNPAIYTVDASSATVYKDQATSSVSAIAVGDRIAVEGTLSGTNVTATTIRDGWGPMAKAFAKDVRGDMKQAIANFNGNGDPIVGGTITAVNGSSITITNKGNSTYTVDASSATVKKANATSSVSSLTVGDRVLVQGTVNGTSIIASSVIDQGTPPTPGSNQPAANYGQGPEHGFPGFVHSIGNFFSRMFGFF